MMYQKRKKPPKTQANAVYTHPEGHWCVRMMKQEPPAYQLWFSEGSQWRDTEHGNFPSCKAALDFVANL